MFWHLLISFTFPRTTSQCIEELLRYFHNLIMRHIHNCIFLQNFMTSNSPNHSRMFDKLHNKNFKEQLSDALNSNNYSTKSSKDAKPLKVQLLMYNNERFLSSKTKSSKIAKSYRTTWHFFQSFPPTFEWLLFVFDLWDLRRKIRHHSQNFRGYKWR